jgi:hypothetical protein
MLNLQGQNALPGPKGVKIAGAVMYSGGSHMCYADQPLALSQCSNCTMVGAGIASVKSRSTGRNYNSTLRWPGQTGAYTCSGDLVANHSQVTCDYCCPQNVTELHYLHHPEDCK